MVTEAMLRLEAQRISPRYWESDKKKKPWINIDMQQQIAIENIRVWEINDGNNSVYKISMPGLAQNNYNDRVMIRGKQTERHVIGQYEAKNAITNVYSIINYLTEEEQILYLQLLASNKIRECVEHLRKIETRLNLDKKVELQESVKVLVRKVKKVN